jgi:hypothetical protein
MTALALAARALPARVPTPVLAVLLAILLAATAAVVAFAATRGVPVHAAMYHGPPPASPDMYHG